MSISRQYVCVYVYVCIYDTVTSMHATGNKPTIANRICFLHTACVVIDAEVERVLYSSSSLVCAETHHTGQERNNAEI